MDNNHKHTKTAYFNHLGPAWDNMVGNNPERIKKLDDIIKGLSLKAGMNVLDIGCGNGVLVPLISEQISPGGLVTAMDESQEMIKTARIKHSTVTAAEFISGSIESMELKKKFYTVALAFAVFPHIDDKSAALKNIRESLTDEGALYIFHLSDTKSLNSFHASLDAPVNKDIMPERDELADLLTSTGYKMINYIDRPGFNFVEARPWGC